LARVSLELSYLLFIHGDSALLDSQHCRVAAKMLELQGAVLAYAHAFAHDSYEDADRVAWWHRMVDSHYLLKSGGNDVMLALGTFRSSDLWHLEDQWFLTVQTSL
jgi:hypothetical protein